MKRLVIVLISIIILFFILVSYLVINNNNYDKRLIKEIENNTNIDNINYVNEYGDYYLIMDEDYLYLINNQYEVINRVEEYLLCDNNDNYDIVYDDNLLLYFKDISHDNVLEYVYYDIYSCELVDKVTIGG